MIAKVSPPLNPAPLRQEPKPVSRLVQAAVVAAVALLALEAYRFFSADFAAEPACARAMQADQAQDALAIARSIGSSYGRASCFETLAHSAIATERFADAISFLNEIPQVSVTLLEELLEGLAEKDLLSRSAELGSKLLDRELQQSFEKRAKERFLTSVVPDCLSANNCPDIPKERLHPRTLSFVQAVYNWSHFSLSKTAKFLFRGLLHGQEEAREMDLKELDWSIARETARFRADDRRPKALFVSSSQDENGALDLKNSSYSAGLTALAKDYDLKYGVIERFEDLCKAIKSAAATGELYHVYINVHGSPISMVFGERSVVNMTRDVKECFAPIHPKGMIHLLSCSTGSGFDPIAQKIANEAQRPVEAPRGDVAPQLLSFSATHGFEHPDVPLIPNVQGVGFSVGPSRSSANLFKTFGPKESVSLEDGLQFFK